MGLSTVEARHDLPLGVPAGSSVRFVHHFDDGWDAQVGVAPSMRAGPVRVTENLQRDVTRSVWQSSAPVGEPNTLLPDGFHQQNRRAPAFSGLNLPVEPIGSTSDHGVISYWTKRSAATSVSLWEPSRWLREKYLIDFTCFRTDGDWSRSQVMGIGAYGTGVHSLGCLLENWAGNSDQDHERLNHTAFQRFESGITFVPDMRWHLVMVMYDTDRRVLALPDRGDVTIFVRGNYISLFSNHYGWSYSNASSSRLLGADPGAVSFVLGTPTGAERFGERIGVDQGYTSDQVMDELVIADLEDDWATALSGSERYVEDRFSYGRYSKQEASYLSPLILPEGGRSVRLLRLDWTAYLPVGERHETYRWGAAEMNPPVRARPLDARLCLNVAAGSAPANSRVQVILEILDGNGDPLAIPWRSSVPGLVGRALDRFRYRVTFRPNLLDPDNNPILESPFLDDVTISYVPESGPRLLAWESQ